MKTNVEAPNLGLIEKEYPYRYKWSSTIGVLITGGLGAFGGAWFATLDNKVWWWLLSIFFVFLFLLGLFVTVINIWGNRKFILTRDNIYLPSIWKSKTYTLIPFSEIDKAILTDVQGNVILRLFFDGKEYSITHSWLPSIDSFNEILQIVNERAKFPLDTSRSPS